MRYGVKRGEVSEYCDLLVSRLDDRIPREIKADILYHAAILYVWGGFIDKAVELVEKWSDKLKGKKKDALQERFKYLLGTLKTLKRDPEGEEMRAQVRRELLEMGRGDLVFDICKSVGDVIAKEDPETALILYMEAYELSPGLKLDAELMLELTQKMTFTAKDIGDEGRAIFYALKSLEYAKKTGSGNDIFAAYITAAELYRNAGDIGRAIEYLAVALDFARKQGLREELGRAAVALAELYEMAGDEERALKLLRENRAFIDELEDEEIKEKARKMLEERG